jgi:hypothetical protein
MTIDAAAVIWDFADAITAARRTEQRQREAEALYHQASESLANAERTYRIALAGEIMRLHTTGVAWSTSEELARGMPAIAEKRYERDLAKGVLKSAESALWRHNSNRRDCREFVEWSRQAGYPSREQSYTSVNPSRA